MSRFQIREAQREKLFVKVALAGPSGAGKTLSALLMAYGMVLGKMGKDIDDVTDDESKQAWSRVCLVDTENNSGLYYVGAKQVVKTKKGPVIVTIHPFKHIEFQPPYEPQAYEEVIWMMAKNPDVQVGVVDSISHEWNGEGGALQMVEKFGQTNKGGNFSGWGKVTPLHDAFIESIKQSPLHLICTMRSKQEHIREEINGKTNIRKVGMNSVQREGVDYEFGVIFDVNMDHTVSSSKDRTKIFEDLAPFFITPGVGKRLIQWAMSGEGEMVREVKQPTQSHNTAHEKTESAQPTQPAQQQAAQKTEPPKEEKKVDPLGDLKRDVMHSIRSHFGNDKAKVDYAINALRAMNLDEAGLMGLLQRLQSGDFYDVTEPIQQSAPEKEQAPAQEEQYPF